MNHGQWKLRTLAYTYIRIKPVRKSQNDEVTCIVGNDTAIAWEEAWLSILAAVNENEQSLVKRRSWYNTLDRVWLMQIASTFAAAS